LKIKERTQQIRTCQLEKIKKNIGGVGGKEPGLMWSDRAGRINYLHALNLKASSGVCFLKTWLSKRCLTNPHD